MDIKKMYSWGDVPDVCPPGGKIKMSVELPDSAQGCRPVLPVMIVRGATDGPRMLILAGQHGRELHGPVGIARAFERIEPSEIRGTLVMMPVLNPLAIRMRRQDYPGEDSRYRQGQIADWNMNRTWGRQIHTYAGIISSFVEDGFVSGADVVLDLHGWSSATTAWSNDRELLMSFGVDICLLYPDFSDSLPGMLDACSAQHGAKIMLVELAPQNVLIPDVVDVAENGIINALRSQKMLSGKPVLPARQYLCRPNEESSLTVAAEDIVEPLTLPGEYVRENQVLARQWSLDKLELIEEFRAPHDGLVTVAGGAFMGEDIPASCVYSPGQRVVMIRRCMEIIDN
ncbi:MAG: succinylglutamate desuccinylase/aspartoacylase family protein [Victivallales bacterium]|nr:succinylglutamate desuccinylase/aspartoacylase family protein [Victivallales bacterium]